MASKVEICNLALAAIRAKSINSLTEASAEAQQCRLHYDIARKFCLRDAQWQFAKKSAALQLRTEEPLHWVYAYQYPGDCLKLRMVTGDYAFKASLVPGERSRLFYNDSIEPDEHNNYEIFNEGDNKIIATDVPEAYGIYTRNVEDTTLFDDTFVVAFSYYLGSLIAIPLTGADIGRAMRKEALQLYSTTMGTAIANDQNEQKRPPRKLPSLVEARR